MKNIAFKPMPPRPLWFGLTILLASTGARAGAFVAECSLQNGDKFVLRAEYERHRITLRHNPPISVKDGWAMYYKGARHVRASRAPGNITYRGLDEVDCTHVGMVNGVPVVHFSFLGTDGRWFPYQLLPNAVFDYGWPDARPPEIRQRLAGQDLDIASNEGFVVPFGNTLIYEGPVLDTHLTKDKAVVVAVLQTVSMDGGKTWSKPEITTAARIYELGKNADDQGFFGKLEPGSKRNVP